MKPCLVLQSAFLLCAASAHSQGTFIYDQQSATNGGITSGDNGYELTLNQPMGQSFTPILPSVGFVQFQFLDPVRNNGIGATVYVNLRRDSITGTLLGSTAPVTMPDDELGNIRTFLFPTDIPVTPGTEYFFQPVLQTGETRWSAIGNIAYGYPSGDAFFKGNRSANGTDLWFREGVVPEPSASFLLLLGLPPLLFSLRRRRLRVPE